MKTTTRYGSRSYGNQEDAKRYRISIQRFRERPDYVRIEFAFDDAAEGRGTGCAAGTVKSLSIQLPVAVLQKLAIEIDSNKCNAAARGKVFHVDERGDRA